MVIVQRDSVYTFSPLQSYVFQACYITYNEGLREHKRSGMEHTSDQKVHDTIKVCCQHVRLASFCANRLYVKYATPKLKPVHPLQTISKARTSDDVCSHQS